MISNDSIKNTLLDIELLYKKLKGEEEHYRFDTETVIYEPIYELMDINALVSNFAYQVSNGQAGKNVELSKEKYEIFLKNTKIKNGFVLTIFEYNKMNSQMSEMIKMSKNLIKIIDSELKK